MNRPSFRIVEPWSDPRSYRPDPVEMLRERLNCPSTLERIADALAAPRMIPFYLGFYAGCMATVGSAIIAAKVWQ